MSDTGLTPFQQMHRDRNRRARLTDAERVLSKARQAEKSRRYQEARRRTTEVLMQRHPQEWTELFSSELAGVNQERGPLPGDTA